MGRRRCGGCNCGLSLLPEAALPGQPRSPRISRQPPSSWLRFLAFALKKRNLARAFSAGSARAGFPSSGPSRGTGFCGVAGRGTARGQPWHGKGSAAGCSGLLGLGSGSRELLDAGGGAGGLNYTAWLPGKAAAGRVQHGSAGMLTWSSAQLGPFPRPPPNRLEAPPPVLLPRRRAESPGALLVRPGPSCAKAQLQCGLPLPLLCGSPNSQLPASHVPATSPLTGGGPYEGLGVPAENTSLKPPGAGGEESQLWPRSSPVQAGVMKSYINFWTRAFTSVSNGAGGHRAVCGGRRAEPRGPRGSLRRRALGNGSRIGLHP